MATSAAYRAAQTGSRPYIASGTVVGDNERGIELEVLDRLGVGGSGIVYKARVLRQPSGPPLPDVVAVKAISTAGLSQAHEVRVKEEITIHKSLKHKNIVRLLSFFTDKSYVFLVMELCEGGDLERVIGRQGLSEADARSYLEQIINAIDYFHSMKIFHRDLKASNVLLASDGTAKVCDFGLAKVQSSSREIHMTMCGTPSSMAPEVARGIPYSDSVDIYNAGAILFHMLAGHPRNDAPSKVAAIRQATESPRIPDHISDCARDLLDKMLYQDPTRRPSIQQVLSHPFLQARNTMGSSVVYSTSDSGLGSSLSTSSRGRAAPKLRSALLGPLPSLPEEAMGKQLASHRALTPTLQQRPSQQQLYRARSNSVSSASSAAAAAARAPSVALAEPFSTARLKCPRPAQEVSQGISASLLHDGSVQCDFWLTRDDGRKVLERMSISGDSKTVRVEKHGDVKEFSRDSLPASFWKKFNYVSRYVQCIRETTPVVVLYKSSAKCMLMDCMNFVVNFQDGAKATYTSSNGVILLQQSDRDVVGERFSYPLIPSILDRRHLRSFQQWHEEAKNIERFYSESGYDFPVRGGRDSLKESCKSRFDLTSQLPLRTLPPPSELTAATATTMNGTTAHSLVSTGSEGKAISQTRFSDGCIFQWPNVDGLPFRFKNAKGKWEECWHERDFGVEMRKKWQQVRQRRAEREQAEPPHS